MVSEALKRLKALGMRAIRTDLLALTAVLVTIAAAWCFLEIADEVAEGSTRRPDGSFARCGVPRG